MKVLQVIDSGGLYGAERVLLSLMTGLKKEGVDATLASIAEPGLAEKPLEAEARRQGQEVRRVTMRAGADLGAARQLLRAAKDEGYEVIQTHGYKANTLLACVRREYRHIPAVATLHGWTAPRLLSRMGLYEAVERAALRRADRVVSVSRALAERWGIVQKFGGKLKVIPNGVEELEFDDADCPLPKSVRDFIDDRPSILAVGRLSQEKGFDVLIESLSILRREGLDACLVLAGEGPERGYLQRVLDDRGLVDAVKLIGFVNGARRLMPHFQALAVPSHTEGLPIAVLEAIWAGLPVAATAVGDIPDVMRRCDAGKCVTPGRPSDLARKLEELLTRPPSLEKRHRSAEIVRRCYSSQAMTTSYIAVYGELRV